MQSIQKVFAGLLLTFGLPVVGVAAISLLDGSRTAQDREGAVAALIVLGFPATAWGGYLAGSLYCQSRQQAHKRLQSIFFQLLKAGNGHLAILPFAMETQLTGRQAKQYLDQKTQEFDARFDVDHEGGISYYFNLGGLNTDPPAIFQATTSTEENLDMIPQEGSEDRH